VKFEEKNSDCEGMGARPETTTELSLTWVYEKK
jgi:hypothetical protein